MRLTRVRLSLPPCADRILSQMIDFQKARSFVLKSARRIICGVALCFLAALLAFEAKTAWVANAGEFPTDLTAVKLSPAAVKPTDAKVACSSPMLTGSTQAIEACSAFDKAYAAKDRRHAAIYEQKMASVARLACFAPPQFLRPPPVL